jgi:hypothetical protein
MWQSSLSCLFHVGYPSLSGDKHPDVIQPPRLRERPVQLSEMPREVGRIALILAAFLVQQLV